MGLRIWTYYFKNALQSIFGQRLIHFVSMGTIAISFLLLGSFLLLFVNLNAWVMEWGKSLSMSVYLKDDIGEETKKKIENALRRLPGVEMTGLISKEKALSDLIEGFGAQSGLLDGLRKNPLPASFEIVFRDMNQKRVDPEKIKARLEKIKGIDEVQYSEQWVERFEGFLYMLKVGGIVIGGLLSLAVLFITTNTIKLTIYARKDEIEILKLVGATDWFVKIPFLIEGSIQGFLGGSLALIILFLVYMTAITRVDLRFGFASLDIIFLSPQFTLLLLLLSIIIGFIGSTVSLGRFFRI